MKVGKPLYGEKGFTLVEIIVSLAILGIITAVFLTVFTGMYRNIASAGAKSKALYETQKQVENALADTGTGNSDFNIKFNGGDMTVKGRIVEIESVTVFIPVD